VQGDVETSRGGCGDLLGGCGERPRSVSRVENIGRELLLWGITCLVYVNVCSSCSVAKWIVARTPFTFGVHILDVR